MTHEALVLLLDNIDIAYYETGADYDCDLEAYQAREIAHIEQEHQLSIVEWPNQTQSNDPARISYIS